MLETATQTVLTPQKYFVLVVDSSFHHGHFLASHLRAQGCYAAACTSGADALKYVAENEPDAIVSDWNLSDMDGLELARRVKQRTAQTKVILLIEEVDGRLLGRALENGGDDLLPKSRRADEIVRAMDRVVERTGR